ncbi:ABC transporter permease [Paracraurococcus lichenis]|uniref:ABC transporter permease n=1 Tax=Paracraurococcus lichenis TaxID=3064888 RepID=A0ABT9E5Q1_9PROT|nr:ABC transporter permease [Paracraurococcus sp. LOR1-02]MDO9711464.1 ABC transporter permease [Paracraurococcus sp. LOR1-02]
MSSALSTGLHPVRSAAASEVASRARRGWLSRLGRQSIALAAFFLLWEILPRTDLVDSVFLPPFSLALGALWRMLLSGALFEHLAASLTRVLAGLLLAILVWIPAGLVIGSTRRLAEILDPLLELFRNTAPLALLPVFTLMLGIGETSKIAMVFYSASWPLLLSTITAVRTVDPLLLKAARSMGLGPVALFRKVVLPASVPSIFTGIRLAAGLSLLVLIAAEMVGAKAGLGYLVNAAQFNFQIPEMYAGILTLSLLGVGLNAILVAVQRRLMRWNQA